MNELVVLEAVVIVSVRKEHALLSDQRAPKRTFISALGRFLIMSVVSASSRRGPH